MSSGRLYSAIEINSQQNLPTHEVGIEADAGIEAEIKKIMAELCGSEEYYAADINTTSTQPLVNDSEREPKRRKLDEPDVYSPEITDFASDNPSLVFTMTEQLMIEKILHAPLPLKEKRNIFLDAFIEQVFSIKGKLSGRSSRIERRLKQNLSIDGIRTSFSYLTWWGGAATPGEKLNLPQEIPFDEMIAIFKQAFTTKCTAIVDILWQENKGLQQWWSGQRVVAKDKSVWPLITTKESVEIFKLGMEIWCGQFFYSQLWDKNKLLHDWWNDKALPLEDRIAFLKGIKIKDNAKRYLFFSPRIVDLLINSIHGKDKEYASLLLKEIVAMEGDFALYFLRHYLGEIKDVEVIQQAIERVRVAPRGCIRDEEYQSRISKMEEHVKVLALSANSGQIYPNGIEQCLIDSSTLSEDVRPLTGFPRSSQGAFAHSFFPFPLNADTPVEVSSEESNISAPRS